MVQFEQSHTPIEGTADGQRARGLTYSPDPISMFNPSDSQVGKGGLPSLHSNWLGSGGKPPFPA